MTPSAQAIAYFVRSRAGDRCEYCKMHQSLQGATFHLEHVQPSSKGGAFTESNLAWCCPSCNLHKSNRVAARDDVSATDVSLFNPRTQEWREHFPWSGQQLVGLTPSGRATIELLRLNAERRLLIRQAEARFGLFPP